YSGLHAIVCKLKHDIRRHGAARLHNGLFFGAVIRGQILLSGSIQFPRGWLHQPRAGVWKYDVPLSRGVGHQQAQERTEHYLEVCAWRLSALRLPEVITERERHDRRVNHAADALLIKRETVIGRVYAL